VVPALLWLFRGEVELPSSFFGFVVAGAALVEPFDVPLVSWSLCGSPELLELLVAVLFRFAFAETPTPVDAPLALAACLPI
jgi:hypothetical protein